MRNVFNIIFGSIFASICFMPTLMISAMVSDYSIWIAIPFVIVMAFLYSLMIFSKSKPAFIFKWLLTLPQTAIMGIVFKTTGFIDKAHNYMEAKGFAETASQKELFGFPISVSAIWIFFFAICCIGVIIAFCKKPKELKPLHRVQMILGIIVSLIIFCAIFTCYRVFKQV